MSDVTPAAEPTEAVANAKALALLASFDAAAPVEPPMALEAQPKPEAPAQPPQARISLADTIRQAREEREGTHKLQAEHRTVSTENERLKARIAELEGTDPEKDILGWVRSRKIDRDRQSIMGQALLYDLVPDRAPADFRVKLLEQKLTRENAEREARDAEARRQELAAQGRAQLDYFHRSVSESVRASRPGSYPESDAWFGEDHDTRVKSLVATAHNIATVATQQGRAADLTPANIAAVLEADLAGRFKAYGQRRAAVPKAQADTPVADKGAALSTPAIATSTKGLTGGTARPQATTDGERARRAAEVMFGSR